MPCRWRLWLAWQHHLGGLHAVLHAMQPRLAAALALRRWLAGVAVAQAANGAICHRALQLPRVFAAWRLRALRSQELRLQAEWCQRLLACRRRRGALLAWRRWAAGRRDAQQSVHQLAERRAFLRKQAVFAAWKRHSQLKAAQREHQLLAAAHCTAWLQCATLQRWRRWAGLRHCGGRWRRRHMLQRAFCSWRQRAAAKAQQAERWRMAVRHCYLSLLWAGLRGLRLHHQRRRHKQWRLENMRQCYRAALLRRFLEAWSGPFLTAARQRRVKHQAAAAMARRLLLAPVMAAWHGPLLAAARRQRSILQAADSHHAACLVSFAWRSWLQWQERQRGKWQRLAAVHALLRPGRMRRLLAAWRSWHAESVLQSRHVRGSAWGVLACKRVGPGGGGASVGLFRQRLGNPAALVPARLLNLVASAHPTCRLQALRLPPAGSQSGAHGLPGRRTCSAGGGSTGDGALRCCLLGDSRRGELCLPGELRRGLRHTRSSWVHQRWRRSLVRVKRCTARGQQLMPRGLARRLPLAPRRCWPDCGSCAARQKLPPPPLLQPCKRTVQQLRTKRARSREWQGQRQMRQQLQRPIMCNLQHRQHLGGTQPALPT